MNGERTTLLKRTVATAGSLTGYAWYVLFVFITYALYDVFISNTASPIKDPLRLIVGWVYNLFFSPLIAAGLFGGIYEQQKPRQKEGTGGVLRQVYEEQSMRWQGGLSGLLAAVRRNFWRIAGANFILWFVLLIGAIAIGIAARPGAMDSSGDALSSYADVPISAITLFWFAALVTEGGLFRSLGRGLKVLLNPLALAIGIIWALTRFADRSFLRAFSDESYLAARVAISAGLAIVRVVCTVYALALYRQIRGEGLEALATERAPSPSKPAASGLINASFGFTFVAFLPLVHLVPLVLGILALKRRKQFVLRSAIACAVGGFFTVFYLMLAAGSLISGIAPSKQPTYAFLAEENPNLATPVALLRQGAYSEAEKQVESSNSGSPQDWATNCALAIAKFRQRDLGGALDRFHAAAQEAPDRSEFYFFYGLALLANNQETMAADQFRLAAAHAPNLPEAQRYVNLLGTIYRPSLAVSSVFYVVILLVLFTLHEYGHAYAAWKLGDDTAKNAGRLTLNPIRHLDLFGSIILPGILLWRQSEVIFGWAKPTPVNPQNFKDPRKDHVRVSFAGPAANLLIAMACFILLGCFLLALRLLWVDTLTWHIAQPFSPLSLVGPPLAPELIVLVAFLKQLMYTSLALGFLNLLPIPPLDGSWILAGLLPQGLGNVFARLQRFGLLLFLLLALTPAVSYYLAIPLGLLYAGLHLIGLTVGLG